MPSVLLNTTSMSTVVTAPMLIPFMRVYMVTTQLLILALRLELVIA